MTRITTKQATLPEGQALSDTFPWRGAACLAEVRLHHGVRSTGPLHAEPSLIAPAQRFREFPQLADSD